MIVPPCAVQVQHRTRIWRRGKSCGTCTTVIGWRGLRTAEASSSGWYPDVGTPIPTAGRNFRLYVENSLSCWRTTWMDTTWISRASLPSAPTEEREQKKRGLIGFTTASSAAGNGFPRREKERETRVGTQYGAAGIGNRRIGRYLGVVRPPPKSGGLSFSRKETR